MKAYLPLCAFALVVAHSPIISAESGPSELAPVAAFFNDYNRRDIAAVSKLFAETLSVTDAFPPFHWQGRDAFKHWMDDLDKYNTANKYSDYDFKVGTPLSQDTVGDRANVVVPVELDLKHDAKPERYDGLVNVVLQRTHDVWKITAFTWTTKAGPSAD